MPSPNVNPRIRLLSHPQIASEIDALLIDRQARGLSPRTVAWYAEKLRILRAYLDAQGIQDVQGITADLLRRFLLSLAEAHNPGGVHGCYRALRAFLRWYESETEPQGWANPIAKVREPRVEVRGWSGPRPLRAAWLFLQKRN